MTLKRSIHKKIAHLKIPRAKMKYPTTGFVHTLKYIFWCIYTPIHPFGRDLFLKVGLINHTRVDHIGRQPFILGKIDLETSLEACVRDLLREGYGNHFIAWKDKGEIISLRHPVDFVHQYHLRIFEDGEVRGHYEYTPESEPALHLKEIGMEDRSADFLRIIGKYLLPISA